MSVTYEDLEYTKYPDSIDTFDRIINPTVSDLPAIKSYYRCIDNNDLEGANQIVEDNPRLKRMKLDYENINKIYDSLIAIERFYFTDVQTYIMNVVRPKGTWNSTTKYVKMDVVNYINNGAIESYLCIGHPNTHENPPIGTVPTDTNYWLSITLRGEKGASGTNLSPRGKWSIVSQYEVNDMVTHNNAIYYAATSNEQSEPTQVDGVSTNDNWVCVMVLSQAADTILMPYGKSIANVIDGLQLDDFSRLIGDKYRCEYDKNDNPKTYIRKLIDRSDSTVYATKTTTREEDSTYVTWTTTTICESANYNKTIIVRKNKSTGKWEGV